MICTHLVVLYVYRIRIEIVFRSKTVSSSLCGMFIMFVCYNDVRDRELEVLSRIIPWRSTKNRKNKNVAHRLRVCIGTARRGKEMIEVNSSGRYIILRVLSGRCYSDMRLNTTTAF